MWSKYTHNPHQEGHILIEYGTEYNDRLGGWQAVVWENGRRTSGWKGYDEDVALAVAREEAREAADRFVGEWEVEIKERS